MLFLEHPFSIYSKLFLFSSHFSAIFTYFFTEAQKTERSKSRMAHIWEVEKIMAPHETPSNNDDDKKIPKFNNDIQ